MDVPRTLRQARQAAGLSQRGLAGAAGLSPATVSALESGSRSPTLAVLTALLAACGLELVARPASPSVQVDAAAMVAHLRLSLTARLDLALERAGLPAELVRRSLSDLARRRPLQLHGALAVALWVPDVAVEPPVVLTGPGPVDVSGVPVGPPRVLRGPEHLDGVDVPDGVVVLPAADLQAADLQAADLQATERHPTGRQATGRQATERQATVRVPLDQASALHVLPPATLAHDSCLRTWHTALDTAATLLDERAGRDEAGRRAPAHRQPDESQESRRLSGAVRYSLRERPQAVESRAWRLDAVVSLPQWLAARGLPPLRGQDRPARERSASGRGASRAAE